METLHRAAHSTTADPQAVSILLHFHVLPTCLLPAASLHLTPQCTLIDSCAPPQTCICGLSVLSWPVRKLLAEPQGWDSAASVPPTLQWF